MLSLILPTLNAAPMLEAALRALPPGLADDLIVSDGGSRDGTPAIARALGARVVTGAAGRGGQLARGAVAAAGDWLLFLHADTRLGPGADQAIRAHMADPGQQGRAAVLRLRLDDPAWPARIVEHGVALRVALLALPYGDQGLLIARALYDRIGGFADLPLMEDVDMVRRLGRRRLRQLDAAAITSAARYRRDGYLRRIARNLGCLALYGCGVAPARIKAIYEA